MLCVGSSKYCSVRSSHFMRTFCLIPPRWDCAKEVWTCCSKFQRHASSSATVWMSSLNGASCKASVPISSCDFVATCNRRTHGLASGPQNACITAWMVFGVRQVELLSLRPVKQTDAALTVSQIAASKALDAAISEACLAANYS